MHPLGLESRGPRTGSLRRAPAFLGPWPLRGARLAAAPVALGISVGVSGTGLALAAPAAVVTITVGFATCAPLVVAVTVAVPAARTALRTVPSVAVPATVGLVATAPPSAWGAPVVVVGEATVRAAPAAGTCHEFGGHRRCGSSADQLEPSGRLRTRPGSCQCGDLQTVESAVHLCLQHRPDRGRVGNQVAGNLALGLPSAGGPPGPGAIVSPAGEFDLDSSGHGPQSYTPWPRSTPRRRPSRCQARRAPDTPRRLPTPLPTAGNIHYVK